MKNLLHKKEGCIIIKTISRKGFRNWERITRQGTQTLYFCMSARNYGEKGKSVIRINEYEEGIQMLNVMQVTKKYHKVVANDDISFTIPDGEIGILLGPNGAGKSTIIKCIMGFLKYQGKIQMDGLDNKSVEAKKLMGYVPEIPSLYPNLTVDEHMEFIARAYKLKDYKEYKDELLARFDLEDKKKKFGDELSKGMQQKLSICCGLLPRPKLMIFDEPMIGLDPHAIKELKLLLGELRDQGCTVLLSTHMIDSIEELWDTTYIMKDGKVAAVVRKENMGETDKSLEDIFFEITEGEDKSIVKGQEE